MLVFIDESGDPGLKIGSGSTDYFIVTLVAFEENDEALKTDQRIELLKHELGFPPHFEFHFTNVKGVYRAAFLSAGGSVFGYIPCLNDQHEWIAALAGIAIRHMQGWDTEPASVDGAAIDTLETQRQRALAAGAAA